MGARPDMSRYRVKEELIAPWANKSIGKELTFSKKKYWGGWDSHICVCVSWECVNAGVDLLCEHNNSSTFRAFPKSMLTPKNQPAIGESP